MSNLMTNTFSFNEMEKFAAQVCKTDFVPRSFKNNGAAVVAAIQYGKELGMPPMQAINSLNVINGKVSMSVEMMKAVVMGSGLCEYALDTTSDTKSVVRIKRKGAPEEVERTFTIEDARKANLVKNGSPWVTYPSRMVYARAMGFALRDVFPDVLAGLVCDEEAQDYPAPSDRPEIKDVNEPPPETSHEEVSDEKKDALRELKPLIESWKAASPAAEHQIKFFLNAKQKSMLQLSLDEIEELKEKTIMALSELEGAEEENLQAAHSYED